MSKKGAYEIDIELRVDGYWVTCTPNKAASDHGYKATNGGPYETRGAAERAKTAVVKVLLERLPNAEEAKS